MHFTVIFLILFGFSNAQTSHDRPTIAHPTTSSEDYLLPNYYSPSLYQVELEPNFETDTFNGSVRINLTIVSNVNYILLHKYELDIVESSIRLLDQNGNFVDSPFGTVYSDDDTHFYYIIFSNILQAGTTYILAIDSFSGILNRDDEGFYLARYTDEDGNERKFATTQFQATAARRAFPCFDEPALKAQFDISIVRPTNYHTISNMPLSLTTSLTEGRFRDTFERTVVMSTYLVAFIVSEYTSVSSGNQRIFGRPEIISEGRGDYALEISEPMLNGIGNMVGIPFTLPKMDQAAIPDGYFWAGAMENWGLVICREVYTMYSDRITDASGKEMIATVMGHELGHQWFGNLVSPRYWRYNWLNEGFATYFQYFGADIAEADMDLGDQYSIKVVQFALSIDSSAATRPMTVDAGSPTDVISLFDKIAYEKTGSVVKMVEAFLSTAVFLRGLSIYLSNLGHNAAVPTDLYNGWQQALDESGLPPGTLPDNNVASVLQTWETNSGYPLVTVSRHPTLNRVVLFTQHRFIHSNPDNPDESLWMVPINYATQSNADFSSTRTNFWLTRRTLQVNVIDLQVDDWIIVNKRQSGYFRVNYEADNWGRISRYLNSENHVNIDRVTKAQLIDDSFTLARYDVIDYQIPFDLAGYLARETDYIPFYPFFNALTFLDPYLANSDAYAQFQGYILALVNTALASVGYEELETDRHTVKLNRQNVLSWVCRYDYTECGEIGLTALRDWESNEDNLIPPTLQTVLSCAALRIGDQDDWNFLYDKYISGEVVVKARILAALGCSEDNAILDNFVSNVILNMNSLLESDRLTAFASIYNAGTFGLNYAFNYVVNNYDAVAASFTREEIVTIINGIAARFSTTQQLTELYTFGTNINDVTLISPAVMIALENINWAEQHLPSIINALN